MLTHHYIALPICGIADKDEDTEELMYRKLIIFDTSDINTRLFASKSS